MLSFGLVLPGWLIGGVSVVLFGNTLVIIYLFLVLRRDRSTSVTIVDGISFSLARSGARLVFGLLVCSQNSSNDTSMTGGDRSCLGLFSFRACGVVVLDTVTGGSYCFVSTKVFGSHPVWFENFSISGLDSWTYKIFLFFILIFEMILHGL
jgi:hypothetical protein